LHFEKRQDLSLMVESPILRAELDIIDAHAHAFPDGIATHAISSLCCQGLWYKMQNFHDGTVQGLRTSMDAAGIRRAFLCSVATKPTQVEKITDWSAAVASDRMIPFASIHPAYEEPEREIERIASLGLCGIKFHPQYMNCAVDDPRCLRIARAAARAGLIFTLHAGYHPAFEKHDVASPPRLRRLHDAVPDLPIVACHLGGMEDWQGVVDFLVGTDIYLETSFAPSWCPREMWELIIARHSPHRIVFGTDSPWQDQARELADFKRLPFTPEGLELALSTNAAQLVARANPSNRQAPHAR
jgi:predicted TIM-barrel fold metal-dependent hydrolase